VNMVGIDRATPKDERIMAAAEQVFSHKGYKQATLDEIIKIADTGKGTVYKYYQNKENLFYSLVLRKNTPFVEKLQLTAMKNCSVENKLQDYFVQLIEFMRENGVIWQVLLFEMSGSGSGWQLVHKKEDNTQFEVKVNWGDGPTKVEVETVRRYYEVIHSEIAVLQNILEMAVNQGVLKPVSDLHTLTGSLFFGIIMMVFHSSHPNGTTEEIAAALIDRFMHGHKA